MFDKVGIVKRSTIKVRKDIIERLNNVFTRELMFIVL